MGALAVDDLERSIGAAPAASQAPSFTGVIVPYSANAAAAPTQPFPSDNVQGVTDREIRFGIVVPYSGSAKENGQNYKLGIDVAFSAVNEAGGVNGRQLKLVPADDGFEPTRTL